MTKFRNLVLLNKKEKHYKLHKLYVCEIYKNDCRIGREIVYFSLFHNINPLTKQIYKGGTLYIASSCPIYQFFDISKEILHRGDYLTLAEIREYNKKIYDKKF